MIPSRLKLTIVADRTERILQAEEQILERVEEEPDISTRRLTAEVGVSQFVVNVVDEASRIHSQCCFQQPQLSHLTNGNPHAHQEVRFQRQLSFNMWGGIVNDRLFGPHVLPNRPEKKAQYLEFLNNVLEK